MNEPKGPDYKLLDAIGTGTIKEIAVSVCEAAQAAIPGYTIEEALAFTHHAAEIAEKREKAIASLTKFKGKKVRRTKKNERLLANLEKWNREGDRFSFLKPAGKNFAGVKVYTGTTRRPKQFLRTLEDCKDGSWQEMFWNMRGPFGPYFFQSQLVATMTQVMEERGAFKNEDGSAMPADEIADKVRKVWDQGRRGKEKRGFFDKVEFDELAEPVWFAIGTEAPKWADVESSLPIPEPDLTELQAKHKAQFQDFQGFQWRHDPELPWEFYKPEKDPFVRHLVDGEHVYDGEDSNGNHLTAEEWAVRMIGLAQDVDDPRKKPLYRDNDPKSPTYKAMCYAGWIPEPDHEKWRSLQRCVLGSYKFRQLAQQIGPYSVVGKIRSGSVKSHPMYGCNSLWQAETAVKLGLCLLQNNQEIVGANAFQAEQEKRRAESERLKAEKAAKEAAAFEEGRSRRELFRKTILDADGWTAERLQSAYSNNGWHDANLIVDVRAFAAEGSVVIHDDGTRFTGANIVQCLKRKAVRAAKEHEAKFASDPLMIIIANHFKVTRIDGRKVAKVIYASDTAEGKTDYAKAMAGLRAAGLSEKDCGFSLYVLKYDLNLAFEGYPEPEEAAA